MLNFEPCTLNLVPCTLTPGFFVFYCLLGDLFGLKIGNMPRGSCRKNSYICCEKNMGPFINYIYKQ